MLFNLRTCSWDAELCACATRRTITRNIVASGFFSCPLHALTLTFSSLATWSLLVQLLRRAARLSAGDPQLGGGVRQSERRATQRCAHLRCMCELTSSVTCYLLALRVLVTSYARTLELVAACSSSATSTPRCSGITALTRATPKTRRLLSFLFYSILSKCRSTTDNAYPPDMGLAASCSTTLVTMYASQFSVFAVQYLYLVSADPWPALPSGPDGTRYIVLFLLLLLKITLWGNSVVILYYLITVFVDPWPWPLIFRYSALEC